MTSHLRAVSAARPCRVPWLEPGRRFDPTEPGDPPVCAARLADPLWIADRITMAAAASPTPRGLREAGVRVYAGVVSAVLSMPLAAAVRRSGLPQAPTWFRFDDDGFPAAVHHHPGGRHDAIAEVAALLGGTTMAVRRFVFLPASHFAAVADVCLDWLTERLPGTGDGPDRAAAQARALAFRTALADGACAWPGSPAPPRPGLRCTTAREVRHWLDTRAQEPNPPAGCR